MHPDRGANGYRVFTETHVNKLAFLGRGRALGFSVEDCRTLLALYEDDSRASSDVKAVAKEHLSQISEKISQLEAMRDTLTDLVQNCAGDARPDCPILKDLARG